MTDDTRARILQVALDLFSSRGYYATSVREIAERLGLTKTAVLYHFPSKNDIMAALTGPLLNGMEDLLERVNRAEADADTRRWAVIEGMLDLYIEHRYLLRMNVRDLALVASGPAYERFRDAMWLAGLLVAGPVAEQADQVRAIQALGMLTDPIVLHADLPPELLRPMVVDGVERLYQGRGSAVPLAVAEPAGRAAADGPRPRGGRPRGKGRPRAMTPEMVATARQMRQVERLSADEIGDRLGVSRATVYRHLRGE